MNVKSSLRSKSKISLIQLVTIPLYTSLICIFTILIPSITIAGIPFTLQTLIIIIIANIANPFEAFISVCLYLFLGIIGLPVFSGLNSGIGILLGPTGGFLISFPFASLLISYFKQNKFIINIIINIFFGIIFIYAIGTIQLALVNNINYFNSLKIMIGFIPIDLIKIIIATIIATKLNKVLPKTC